MANISSLNKGLVLDLPLNGQVKDRSPYNNDGTKTGFSLYNATVMSGASWGTGKYTNGVTFIGSPTEVIALDTSLPAGSDSFTQMCWFYATNNDGYFFSYGTQGVTGSFNGFKLSAGSPRHNFWGDDLIAGSTSLNAWHHTAATWDNSTGSRHIYIDGTLSNSDTPNPFVAKIGSLYIGARAGQDDGHDGKLSNIRMWNRALSGTQITDEMNSPIAVAGSGLVGCWEMNEGHGNFAYDTNDTVKGPWSESKAIRFNGTTENITVSDNATILDIWNEGGTVAQWIYPTTASWGVTASKGASIWRINLNSLTTGSYSPQYIQYFGTDRGKWGTNSVEVAQNKWNHLVTTYTNNTGSDPIIYVNGASVAITKNETPAGTLLSDTGNDLLIMESTGGQETGGACSDFKMYRRILSALEVSQLYNQSKGGYLK